ncbi:MAG: ATP-binding protein [Chitinophagales bacterium]
MMDKYFIGREEEKEILRDALQSHEAEMVAVIGRRRVGKTFLIKSVYKNQLVFEVTGLQNASKKEQLENFVLQLAEASGAVLPIQTPSSWLQAFALLIKWLKQVIEEDNKKVVFLDELPWMATHKSGFLSGLSYFWNSWAVNQNIVVVICGSAASWMIRKVVNNRGGLYNRITKRIYLAPFTLAETEEYLKARNIYIDRYQITQLYMALGGIPHHLKEVKKGKSATQNINQICFSKNGLLRDEFLRLYPSLFANAEHHMAVIRALATKHQGITRKEINQLSKVPMGGSTSRTLEELVHSGFISTYRPYGKKKKETHYRLTDEYSLFYLKFIEGKEYEGKNIWHHLNQTQTYISWSGYAFESICLKHIPQIKKALKIEGIFSLSSVFSHKGSKNEKGTQIDLLIDRKDQVINLFEIKYYNEPFVLSKSYTENLKNKAAIFKKISKTNKQLFLVFIAPFGVKQNEHSLRLIDQILKIDALFLKE